MEGSFISHALTTLFILLQFTTYMKSCSAIRPTLVTETNTDFIKKSCDEVTIYPKLCYTSLSTYANKIKSSPKRLAATALSVTLSATKSTSVVIKNMSKSHGLKLREAEAISDCVELVGDSVDELRRSMEELAHMGGSNFEFRLNNIQTWVSGALTNDDTCMDGFAGKGMNGQVKTTVRGLILGVANLTSNALALINNYGAIHRAP
ncbi:Pectinesterase inhibitor domain protein [Actinidia chinensis var. chinensis]|uniref:Pectinesterase inhibitor domain protein n=1 Tax=Actinidia chinensis var. chinensis TaxID=1590841 RepID=A0A2R6QNJ6_ACTCC|nr:Pectinesterase inhibitor domain protein [Actinidia chinensis var. chinensis]